MTVRVAQQVPQHFDAPYFHGANRFDVPIWLLVVMEASGLWAAQHMPQVQGVAYLQQLPSDPNASHSGGHFYFYPRGVGADAPLVKFAPRRGAALILDGTATVHGTDPWRPELTPPPLRREDTNELVYDGASSTWVLRANGAALGRYGTNDLRIALVWRALCFASEADRAAAAAEPRMALEDILGRLEADLRARGVLPPAPAPRPPPLEFGLLLVRYYAPYAFADEALVKTNYCVVVPAALPRAFGDAFKAMFCAPL